MRPIAFLALLLSLCLAAPTSLWADVLVFQDGSVSEVASITITDRAVHYVTLNGKRMSVIRDAVDVPATLSANRTVEPEKAPAEHFANAPWQPTRVHEAPPPIHSKTPPTVTVPTEKKAPQDVTTPVRRPPPSRPRPVTTSVTTPPRATSIDVKHPDHRFAFFVNGALGTSALDFADSRSFELFLEQARFDQRYRSPETQGVELGAYWRIKGPVGIGASAELFRSDKEAAYSAVLPHPFYFERNRELSGQLSGLVHEEQALHVNAVVSKTWAGRFTVDVFGGPSLFLTKTEVLVDVPYAEVYPYDTVVPGDVETRLLEDHPLGYNVGAGVTFRLAGPLGIDLGARYSQAQIRIAPSENGTIEFLAGGFRLGAGLRFLFR